MKKRFFALLAILVLMATAAAYAEKARNIASAMDASYHAAHLEQHIGATDLRGTGNYLKVRELAKASKVLGHLEQADRFTLLALQNGYAQVEVLQAADTSPDSWVGLKGWVSADYIDCNCSEAQYYTPAADPSLPLKAQIPAGAVGQYIFCSGAGGWATYLTLLADGTFLGDYHDSDMGDGGDTYPNGTQYFCAFDGQFANLTQINDYAYALTLDALTVVPAKDHIDDGVRYIASDPYGVESGKSFILYTPATPKSAVTEDFLMWMGAPLDPKPNETIGCYAIYNETTGYAFIK